MINIKPKHIKWFGFIASPLSLLLLATCFIVSLYFALIASPADYQQGDSVRIMYIHVPAAWLSLMHYVVLALCSIGFVIWRNPLVFIIAKYTAKMGCAFAAITLATGMIWGKPIWGAWWVWDARLTSVLVLFFFYLGYLQLTQTRQNQESHAMSASLIALVGAVNLPIIKFSVDWWQTLHQPASIIRSGGIAIDNNMLLPLLLFFITLSWASAVTIWLGIDTQLRRNKRHHAILTT